MKTIVIFKIMMETKHATFNTNKNSKQYSKILKQNNHNEPHNHYKTICLNIVKTIKQLKP